MSDYSSPTTGLQASPSPLVPAIPPVPPAQVVAPTPRYRTFTFGIGFLCGQASLIFIAVLFLRYVVFEDPKKALREAGQRKKKRLRSKNRQRRGSSALRGGKGTSKFATTTSIPASDQLLLSKLSYDISTHAAESCDWLNVLVAQAVSAYRSMILDEAMNFSRMHHHEFSDEDDDEDDKVGGGRGAKRYVEKALNTGRGEGERQGDTGIVTLDYITVTEFDFGQEYPVCSNARVRPSNESGKVRIEVDIDYSDHVSLAVETKVLINFPRPRFAVIPVNLALALVQFSATITVEVPPPSFTPMADPSASSNAKATMTLSLHPDFILELASTSLIGSRAKLQDIPKVEQLIIGRIRNYVIENFVWPKVRTFNLPKIGGKAQSKPPSTPNPEPMDDGLSSPEGLSSPDDGASELSDYIPSARERHLSPSSGSALDEEDELDDIDGVEVQSLENDDGSDSIQKPNIYIQTEVSASKSRPFPHHKASQTMVSSPLRSEGFSSAVESSDSQASHSRRNRRVSSLSSKSFESSNDSRSRRSNSSSSKHPLNGLTSVTSLDASRPQSPRSDSTSGYNGYYTPAYGVGLSGAPNTRSTLQSYFPATATSSKTNSSVLTNTYSGLGLQRNNSTASLPAMKSPTSERPPHGGLASLLGNSGTMWEAERRAEEERSRHTTSSSTKRQSSQPVSPPSGDQHVHGSTIIRSDGLFSH